MTTLPVTFDLDALEALAKAATPGPWITDGPDSISQWMVYGADGWVVTQADVIESDLPAFPRLTFDQGVERANNNATYIAAASPDVVLALIARLRAAEAPRSFGHADWIYDIYALPRALKGEDE